MPLHAGRGEIPGHRAAPPDLHHLAHAVRAGRFPHDAMVHPLAIRGHPLKDCDRAVFRVAFFIAGNRDRDRTFWRGLADIIDRGGHEGSNAGFHIHSTAPIHPPVNDFSTKRIMGPVRKVTNRYHIGMSVETKHPPVASLAPARKQVADPAPIYALRRKSRIVQQLFQQHQRAAFFWCNRCTAHKIGRQLYRIHHIVPFGH